MVIFSLIDALHISAFLAMFIFQASATAICRAEFFNCFTLRRLVKVTKIYFFCTIFTLFTGAIEFFYGKHGIVTGIDFLSKNKLLHTKLLIFLIFAAAVSKSLHTILTWNTAYLRNGNLPSPQQITKQRRFILIQAHLLILMPFLGAFLSNGYGYG